MKHTMKTIPVRGVMMEMFSYRTTCPAFTGSDKIPVPEKRVCRAGRFVRLFVVMVMLFVSVSSVSAATQVSGNITKDTTWTLAGSPYVVTANIRVQGTDGEDGITTLTVNPGVEVRFNSNCGLAVGSGSGDPGALIAVGTSDNPVTFTASQSGNWSGIRFYNTADDETSVLDHCVVEKAGTQYTYAVYICDSSPSIRNSVISGSQKYGIHVYSGAPEISGNTIKDNSNHGIYIQYGTASITGNVFSGNANYDIVFSSKGCVISGNTINSGIYGSGLSRIDSNIINYNENCPLNIHVDDVGELLSCNTINNLSETSRILIKGGKVTKDAVWIDDFIYIVTGHITVQGKDGEDETTTLTVNSGVEVRFNSNCGLAVGSGSGDPGALIAVGTLDNPVTFTASQSGNWSGIRFYNTADDETSVLDHCVVEKAGTQYTYAVYICDSSPSIRNSVISGSQKYGIHVYSGAPEISGNTIRDNGNCGIYLYTSCTPSITGNQITGNKGSGIYSYNTSCKPVVTGNSISNNGSYPVRVRADIPLSSNTFSGNGNQILVLMGVTLSKDMVWGNTEMPYIVIGNIGVQGKDGGDGVTTLTVNPGVEVRFNSNCGLSVGSGSGDPGALVAVGTSDNPVTFTAAESGNWTGISFNNTTVDETSVLDHCVVEKAGTQYTHALYIRDASPSIRNSVISGSQKYGIHVYSGSPEISGNTIRDNGNCGIYLYTSCSPRITGNQIIGNKGAGIYSYNTSCNPEITENTFSNNESYPVRIGAEMNLSDNTFTGNAIQAIEVLGETIDQDVVWKNEGIPYVVTGSVTVYQPNAQGTVVTLTIDPGATVKFKSGCRLHIGYRNSRGALFAQGTDALPITFTSVKNFPKPGDWPGLYFYNGTADGMSVIEHCIVEYGIKNMEFYDAKPAVRRNIIRYGSHSGLYYSGNGCDGVDVSCNNFIENKVGVYTDKDAGPVIGRNNFIKNSGHRVFNNTAGEIKATNNWWNDVSGPNSSGDLIHGNVLVDPWLTEKSDCTEVPPINIPPFAPQFPSPSDNTVRVSAVEEGNPVAVPLSWQGGDPNPSDTVVYDLATGTAVDELQTAVTDLKNPTYALTGLQEGTTYFWQVTARDTGGLETKGPVWAFTTKGDRPDLMVSEIFVVPEGVIAPDQDVTFTATVTNDGAGPVVDGFRVSFAMDGVVVLNRDLNTIIPSGEDVTVKYAWRAAAGSHSLTVTADALSKVDETFEDNNSKVHVLDEILDTIAPELTGTFPVNGASVSKAETVTVTLADKHGSVDDASVIQNFLVTDAEGEAVEGIVTETNDLFAFTPSVMPLPDGSYSVGVTAFDDSGNSKEYTFSFAIDAVPPEGLTITGGTTASGLLGVRPKKNSSNSSTLTLTGTREENTSVWINGLQRVGTGSDDWSVTIGMAQGANSLEILLKDKAGNASPALWVDVFVDSEAPSVVSMMPKKGAWLTTVPELVTVRYREETSGLNLAASTLKVLNQAGAEIAGQWDSSSDTILVFTPSFPFGEDSYTVHLHLEDNSGNRSALTLNRFSVDFTPPEVPVVNPVTTPTHTTSQLITGTKDSYASVLLKGEEIAGHTEETSWQYAATLVAGDNSFAFTSKDRGGNVSEASTVVIRYDDIAPSALAEGMLKASGEGLGTVVRLDWKTYDESAQGDIASYRIYVSDAGLFTEVSAMTARETVAAGHLYHSVTGLTKGKTYHFAVVPVDRMGNFEPQVHSIAATPQDTIPPQDVTALSVTSKETSLLFTWSKPGGSESDITGYRVCFGDDSTGEILAGDLLNYEKIGLSKASKYPFRIFTRDADGNESAGTTVTGYTWLNNPEGLTVTPHSGYADLSWAVSSPASHVKHYFVYVKEGGAFSDTAGFTPARATTGTSTRVAGLTDNTTYHFAVTAVNLSGGEDSAVISVEATPVPDLQGPELTDVMFSGSPLTGGLVLTASGTITLAAVDAAGVSRIEFYMDGRRLATDFNGSDGYAFDFDIFSVEDGTHTFLIKAYDTLGNMSEFSASVTVRLALPTAPVITSPADGFVTNQMALTVTGNAEKNSDLSFTVNDVDSTIKAHADGQGRFRAELSLAEGVNHIVATAENRAGKGSASSLVNVTLDTTIPQIPEGLQAQTRPSGVVKLSWKETQGAEGVNIYRASASFSAQHNAQKLNSAPVTAFEYKDMPDQDGQWFYRITAVDAVSNESALSKEVAAYSDETPPSAVSIT